MPDVKMKAIGFTDIIRYMSYIPDLTMIVMSAVAMVEAVKAGAPGPEKKAAVLASIQGMWEKISGDYGITATFDKLIPLISLLIDLAVTIYNIFWKDKLNPTPTV